MKQYCILLLACIVLALPGIQCSVSGLESVSISTLQSYNRWRNSNKRIYLNEDEQIYRQFIFFENLQKIIEHNKNTDATYTVGLNAFSDYTEEEFAARVLNRHIAESVEEAHSETEENGNLRKAISFPASVDWRNDIPFNPVQNQGSCGSCSTFGTAGVLESFNYIKNKKLVKFSEQQLLDCAKQAGFDTYGCSGAWQVEYFKYAIKIGIIPAANYPYVGTQTTCKNISPFTKFFPKTYKFVSQNTDSLKTAISQGPVSVTVDASKWGSYSSGIFNGCSSSVSLNHAVIAIGYDAQGNYLIRNSWGTGWGEKGYIRLAANNNCGVLKSVIQVLS